MKETMAIKTSDLTKSFGINIAVDNISIEIKKGELYGLVGPDGAGKTTTMRLLTAIMEPTSGEGWVAGHSILNEGERIKEKIGYMSQRFGLYEDLTVFENILFYADLYEVPKKERPQRIENLLGFSNLSPFKNRLAGRLSGGMKQKLGLACALIHTPEVLFLDEPTNGVDPISRRNFWNLIYEMSKAGTTVFVTTHYMDEADYCDRLALIYRGKIIAEGTPNELRKEYMKQNVLEIETDRFVEAMEILQSEGIEAAIFGNLLHAIVADIKIDIPQIKRILELANIKVKKIEKIPPSLEDVFVTLIEEA